MSKIIIVLLCITHLIASDIAPSAIIATKGNILDMRIVEDTLLVSTDSGVVEIYGANSRQKLQEIPLPKIKDYKNEDINAKVYSTDKYNNSILIVAQDRLSFTSLLLYKDNKLTKIIDDSAHLFIKKVRYLQENTALIYTISNEAYLVDLTSKKIRKSVAINTSTFSDMQISSDGAYSISADESGNITKLDTKTLSINKIYEGLNVDNVYKLDYKNSVIITAGQDRRASIYHEYDSSKDYYFSGEFLIYSVGLSPSAKTGAIAYNDKNDIVILDINSKEKLHYLKAHKATINSIVYLSEDELYSGGDSNQIYYWRIR